MSSKTKHSSGSAKAPANTSTASAPPPANAPDPNAAPPPSGDAKPKRTRNALSKEKQLAIVIAGLIAILQEAKLQAQLTEDEKAKVNQADKLAADLNAQTIEPIKKRIEAIRGEFAELNKAMQEPNANLTDLATKVTELSKELARKQKALQELTAVLS